MAQEGRAPELRLSLLGRNGEVPEKSGLNWWNAGGRVRNADEVYIALPSDTLEQAEEVFGSADKGTTFLARLNDSQVLRMRLEGEQGSDRTKAKQITSDGSKSTLGEWMLRTMLGLAYGVLVTREHLEAYGRTDVTFVREGYDPLTGQAIVQMDFAPRQIDSYTAEVARLELVTTADLDAVREEEADYEGAEHDRFTSYYERQPHLRAQAIAIHGITCKGCGLRFQELYGERGSDYIEVHHLKPVSTLGGATLVDPRHDMTVLCANCHRMVHRRRDQVLSPEQLLELLNGRRLVVVGLKD